MTPVRRGAPGTIAYIVSRFPSATETFIVNEVLALEQLGARIQLFALRHQELAVHSAPRRLVEQCVAGNHLRVRELLGAQLHWIARRPLTWITTWFAALWGNRRSPRFLARALVAVPIAMVFARRIDAERIHAHWATHPALAAWVVHRLTGVPYSVTVHAHDLYVDRSMLHRKLADAAAVVTISDYNARMITALHPELADKVTVIPCGVDTARLQPPAERRTPGCTLQLICVASLQDYKGHAHLLTACRILVERGVRFHLDLVGDGELRDELRASTSRLGLDDVVTFHGARPNDEVLARVADADVMVLPSVVTRSGKMEGVPVVLMEALALGTPAVASDLSGIGELVVDEQTGLLVRPGDGAALAQAIERMATDPALRRRISVAGRQRVEERYDLFRNARRLTAVLAQDSG